MRLTVLGSGTSVPVADRFPAGYLIEHGQNRVMVDCGPGTLRRLAQAGVTPANLDAVLLTHYHTDHCADLAALLFALRSPHLTPRPPLTIYGAPGLKRLVGKLTEAWPWLEPKDYQLILVEWLPGTVEAHGFEITSIPIRHTAQSLGYRIRTADGVVALSGDADTCEELIDLARDADVFVCDTAAPDGQKIDGHLTPGLAADYAQRARARELVLTHFYPECDGVDLCAQAQARFDGKVTMATDLLCLDVGGDSSSAPRPCVERTDSAMEEQDPLACSSTPATTPATLAFDIGGSGLKATVLNEQGEPVCDRIRMDTPIGAHPDAVVALLKEFTSELPESTRISTGFPGMVRNGVVRTAPNLGNDAWRGYDLAGALTKAFGKPARVANDADVQGLAAIAGKGVEMVITLGTGFGTALYQDGRLCPHLEISHQPFRKGETYDQHLGNFARKSVGNKKWQKRVLLAIDNMRTLTHFDHLYVGGGNAKKMHIELPDDVSVIDNIAGLSGGAALWRN